MTHFITSMMQLDLVPMLLGAGLGAGLYAYSLLLSRKMAAGSQRRLETQKLGEDATDLCDNGAKEELGSQSKPEPDAEPAAQPAMTGDQPTKRLSTIVATCLILAAVIITRAAYMSGDNGNSLDNLLDAVATANLAEADPLHQ